MRLGRGGLQQRRHVLVGIQRRCGQVPGLPIWLVVQGAGHLAVRCGTPGKGGAVINSGTDQVVRELHARRVHLDQAELLGGNQRAGI